MSQDIVHAQPMQSRSAMTLEEIRHAMIETRPDLGSLKGGWASMDNHQSNLGAINVAPPESDPVITEADGPMPRMLSARFYYWSPAPPGIKDLPSYDAHASRRLSAIDVVITQEDAQRIGILLSSRSRTLLNQRDGAVASLQKILRTKDASIKIDRLRSHLELLNTDIFLWLTVQKRDRAQIAPELLIDEVSGISGQDASLRTADLRAGVDFDRPNFLTAVAEADTLGPIELSFVHHLGEVNRTYRVKLYIDGGFEIHKSELRFPDVLDGEDLMLRATLQLAYILVPRLNALYRADGDNWVDRRTEVIESAMDDLLRRYESAKAALRERLASSPKPLETEVEDPSLVIT